MSTFENSARYYDLLYADKDYRGEALFVSNLIRQYNPKADSILELGCGTGAHAQELANLGFHVHGIDASSEMLERAHHRKENAAPDISGRLDFCQGDVRIVRVGRRFPVVLSLF